MADEKNKTTFHQTERINLAQKQEVQEWSRKFNVSIAELASAVKEIGDNAREVQAFLRAGRRK